MFNFSTKIENLLIKLNNLNSKEYYINKTINSLFKEKENSLFDKKINKKYYVKTRIKQIFSSLDKNIKKEYLIFKRNCEIFEQNLKIVRENLKYLNSKENKNEEIEKVIKLLERLDFLLKNRIYFLLTNYKDFLEKLISKKIYLNKYLQNLEKILKEEDINLFLKELYLNFKILDDFYYSFKVELSDRLNKINKEIFYLEKKISEETEKIVNKKIILKKHQISK